VVTLFMPKGLAGLFAGWRKHVPPEPLSKSMPQAAE
jgi:hypothetical protein